MSTPAQTVTVSDLIPDLATPPPAASSNAKTDAAGSSPAAAVTDQDAPTAPESRDNATADNVERDSAGVPFDSARHLAKTHPATGRWMPKGGRKPKSAPAAPASSSRSTSSTPPASSGGSPASIPVPADDIPEIGPEDDEPEEAANNAGNGAGAGDAPAGPARDAELSPKAAGELAARALYKVTGALSGDHKRAVAKGAEHESIKQTAAAYFEFRGLKLIGGLALVATVAAYLLTDDRADGIGERLRKWWEARRAGKGTPASSAVIDIEPAAAPAPSGKVHKQPPPPPPPSPFAGRGL